MPRSSSFQERLANNEDGNHPYKKNTHSNTEYTKKNVFACFCPNPKLFSLVCRLARSMLIEGGETHTSGRLSGVCRTTITYNNNQN